MNITLNYKGKSFVVSGSTKEFKDQLMALGGKYNPHLTTGPGFIFFNKRENEEQEVTDFVNNHNKSLNNNGDLLTINKTIKSPSSSNKTETVRSPIPSTKSSINYPNRFIGSDGLSYQIIIETCPLPYLNQKVTVKYNDGGFDSTVSNINDGSPINDITLTYQEEDKQMRAIIENGKWQIHGFLQNHELIFQA
jgi:hypothetical protein